MKELLEFLQQFLHLFKFWEVIPYYERGVRLRLGRWNDKELGHGFHWKMPFGIDEILTLMIKPNVMSLDPQTITTKDDKCIVVQAIIKYEIKDAAKALLEVDNEKAAVDDMTQGIIRGILMDMKYEECNSKDIEKQITDKARREADKWGIRIMNVTIKSLGKMNSLRLLR